MNWCGTSINRRGRKPKNKHDPKAPMSKNKNSSQNTDAPSLHKQISKSQSKSKSSIHTHNNSAKQLVDHSDILNHGLSPNPFKWSESEVSSWIKFIGYSEYCESFENEHIDGDALLSLSKDEVEKIVYALGHRKNILNKVALLKKLNIKYKPRVLINDSDEESPVHQQQSNIPHSQSLPQQLSNNDESKSPYTFDQHYYSSSHPQQYSQDKARDKSTYWELWSKIIPNRDFMLENDFMTMMSRSGLAKDQIDIIWKLATRSNHGRCSFDEFVNIMKLSHLAQGRIPLYIINVSKLIFYHPPLGSSEFFEFSSIFSDLQKQQVLKNMVGFYNLPPQILDSDDRLMELEKQSLRPYHPIHFEINAKVLIATFSNPISNSAIKTLQKSVLETLRKQMGWNNNVNNANNKNIKHLLSQFCVRRPSPKELGMTPAGPPTNGQTSNGFEHPHTTNGIGVGVGVGVVSDGQPHQQHISNNTNISKSHGLKSYPHNPPYVYNNNNNNNTYNHQQQYTSYNSNDTQQHQMDISEMQSILLCDNFWEEFCIRSEIDKIVISQDEKIRTRQAMTLISKLRSLPLKSVKFTDEGVKLVANKTKYELMEQMNQHSNDINYKAVILGLNEMDIPHPTHQSHQRNHHIPNNNHNPNDLITASPTSELYKGIVIEGLPELITSNDEHIRKLDSAVLNEFIVSHIEVVDSVLRITFASEVSHKNINTLRKHLKSFLKDDIKLDKKSMKNVSIIPHTRDTWKGETTEKSVEVHNTNQYIHIGIDSLTAPPQQQPNYYMSQ